VVSLSGNSRIFNADGVFVHLKLLSLQLLYYNLNARSWSVLSAGGILPCSSVFSIVRISCRQAATACLPLMQSERYSRPKPRLTPTLVVYREHTCLSDSGNYLQQTAISCLFLCYFCFAYKYSRKLDRHFSVHCILILNNLLLDFKIYYYKQP